ncbi:MAG: asparagine synthase (glutamine-hydrolyzing) [Elusimicrobia bacterium RIFOXYA2_FULL_39_19]|nr:MAG: asparagine synthase (glutamine-hydrolyzing) [Elusimicrobia bacterium RIFOXYA2_FULL_39_19]
MCGICGFTSTENKQLLQAMTDALIHRGPDGSGYYADNQVSLGMRRLKVIDLNTGDQPIYNEDKSLVIIFNGEIYNFKALRKNLSAKGHIFKTQSDTEVIIHLYEEYKENCVTYLAGMFAFSIWDIKNKKLFIARDRIGIKPLYYSLKGNRLIFSSEINSLVKYPDISRETDPLSLNEYLTFLYIPSPNTIYKEVKQLPAGYYLTWEAGKTDIKKYWDLNFNDNPGQNEEFYLDKFDALLQTVVKEHLISDVPTGIFLSGGIDSSLICAVAAKTSGSSINTFSLGFSKKDSTFNELDKAKIVSDHLKTKHTEHIVSPDIKNLTEAITASMGQPFADSSALVNYLISNISRKDLTVALTGIGGDELFFGYPRYQGIKLSTLLPRIKFPDLFINSIPETYSSYNYTGRIKRFLQAMELDTFDKYLSYISFYYKNEKNRLYTESYSALLAAETRKNAHKEYFDSCRSKSLMNRISYVDIKAYLKNDLLYMADAMSMANSLELRVPLCDHRIVEFAAEMPVALKMKGFKLKHFLKKLSARYLPEEILHKKKQGFMVPIARILRDKLRADVEDFIKKKEFSSYLNYDYIHTMWQVHLNGKRNYADQFWSFLILEKWKTLNNVEFPTVSVHKYKTEKKLNILLVSDIIFEDTEGGSGRMVTEMSKAMVRKGHSVTIITRNPGNAPEFEIRDTREIIRYPISTDLSLSIFSSWVSLNKLISKHLKNKHFDLINYYHPLSALLVNYNPLFKNVPKFYNFNSPWHEEYEIRQKEMGHLHLFSTKLKSFLRKNIEKNMINACRHTGVLSAFMKDRMIKYHHTDKNTITIVPGGIDTARFSPIENVNTARDSLSMSRQSKILFTVRNLEPRMGLENLTLAMKNILKVHPDTLLYIGGNGSMKQKLEELIEDLKLNNSVILTGFIEDDKLPLYYQAADLFILPTTELEGFGLVTVEALSCGTPALGTPIGSTNEVLKELNLLFKSPSPEDMAIKINEYLSKSQQEITLLKEKSRQFVLNTYSWEKGADSMLDIFRKSN